MKTIAKGMMAIPLAAVMFSFINPVNAQQSPADAVVQPSVHQSNAADSQNIEQTSHHRWRGNQCDQCPNNCRTRQGFIARHGGHCDRCRPTNYCPSDTCPSCYMKHHMCLHNLCWKCTQSPGTGWAPPTKNPLSRTGVAYIKYWPNYWNGGGPGQPIPYKPVVYTPTDTTQLGYYYQHVPTWQRMSGMIPPVPQPAQWHVRGVGYSSAWDGYGYGHGGQICDGEVVSGGTVHSEPAMEKATEPTAEEPPRPIVE